MRWSEQDRQYYGVRYTQELNHRSPDDDLWHEYRSSSPDVKEFIEKHGKPDIMYVDETFNTAIEAREYEVKILQENDVVNDDRWLNKNDRLGPPAMCGEANGMSGKVHSPETRQLISEALKKYFSTHDHQNIGKTGPAAPMYGKKHTLETRKTMSNKMKIKIAAGEHPALGSIRSKESKRKQGERVQGEKNPMFKGYYITPWGTYISSIDASQNCPVFIRADTIRKWCENKDKVISENAVRPSSYLITEMIGKTFKEIGFDFIPKNYS